MKVRNCLVAILVILTGIFGCNSEGTKDSGIESARHNADANEVDRFEINPKQSGVISRRVAPPSATQIEADRLIRLGAVAVDERNWQEAIRLYDEAEAVERNSAIHAKYYLYVSKKDDAKVCETVRKMLTLESGGKWGTSILEDADDLLSHYECAMRAGDSELARKMLDRIVVERPRNQMVRLELPEITAHNKLPWVYLTAGFSKMGSGNLEPATPWISKAAQLAPNDIKIQTYYTYYMTMTQDKPKAYAAYRKVKSMSGQTEEVNIAMDRLYERFIAMGWLPRGQQP